MSDTKELVAVTEIDTKDIQPKVNQYLKMAELVSVKNDRDYSDAAQMVKDSKTLHKYIDERFKPTKDALNSAKNELIKMIKSFTVPLEEAEKIIKGKMAVYYNEQEQKRIAEQRRLQEEARKQEEEHRLQEAIDADDESLLDEPLITPEINLENKQKVDGVSYRENPQFEIIDESKVPREYLMPDTVKIGKTVRATRGTVNIPGVHIWIEKTSSIRI